MIEKLLPRCVAAVDTHEDWSTAFLFPEELAAMGEPAEKRRVEFTTARACAHEAFELLGRPAASIPRGAHGEPRWPAGLVGSITHCAGYRACVLAHTRDVAAIGIDAEPHTALPDGLLEYITVAEERRWIEARMATQPRVHWDRLVFSIKEAVYKAWFPTSHRRLTFRDAAISLDADTMRFRAALSAPGITLGSERITSLAGHWQVCDGLILSALALAPPRTLGLDWGDYL